MDLKDRVKRIQENLDLSADGIIGSDTITALEKALKLNTSISMKTVCICIGHSIKDPGCYNDDKNISEFEFNKQLAGYIVKDLEESNLHVYLVNRYTNGGGTGMTADVKAVNANKSDCIVELHCNASETEASGTETLYWESSTKGKYLAKCVNEEIVKVLGLRDRGIKSRSDGDRGSKVLKESYYPMIITEPFFLDNNNDLSKGILKQKELAKAISNGIIKYLYTID